MEFNNYSINLDDPMSLTSLLHGAPQILSINHMYLPNFDYYVTVITSWPFRPALTSAVNVSAWSMFWCGQYISEIDI